MVGLRAFDKSGVRRLWTRSARQPCKSWQVQQLCTGKRFAASVGCPERPRSRRCWHTRSRTQTSSTGRTQRRAPGSRTVRRERAVRKPSPHETPATCGCGGAPSGHRGTPADGRRPSNRLQTPSIVKQRRKTAVAWLDLRLHLIPEPDILSLLSVSNLTPVLGCEFHRGASHHWPEEELSSPPWVCTAASTFLKASVSCAYQSLASPPSTAVFAIHRPAHFLPIPTCGSTSMKLVDLARSARCERATQTRCSGGYLRQSCAVYGRVQTQAAAAAACQRLHQIQSAVQGGERVQIDTYPQ